MPATKQESTQAVIALYAEQQAVPKNKTRGEQACAHTTRTPHTVPLPPAACRTVDGALPVPLRLLRSVDPFCRAVNKHVVNIVVVCRFRRVLCGHACKLFIVVGIKAHPLALRQLIDVVVLAVCSKELDPLAQLVVCRRLHTHTHVCRVVKASE